MVESSGRWKRHLIITVLVLAASLSLFRGAASQGMEMDEVTRVINLIPLVNGSAEPSGNALWSFEVLGTDVPVMFKEYISSAYLVRFLPLVLFPDPLVGLRFLHWFYLVISVLTFYFVTARHSAYLGLFGALLLVTSPLFYPEVRIGFADSLHVLYLSLAGLLLERFFRAGERKLDLFLAVFLLFFCTNQMFYFSWVIAALGLTVLLFFPGYLWRLLNSVGKLAAVILGAATGLIHFVIFNLASGLPTVMVLFNRWLRPDQYAATPIDFKEALPLSEEIVVKLRQLPLYFEFETAYTCLYLAAGLATLFFFVTSVLRGKLKAQRLYFAPLFLTLVILWLILLSPNTTRVGHYVYLAPFLQLSLLTAVLILARLPRNGRLRGVLVWGLPSLILVLNFTASNRAISNLNRTGGTGLFSPAIFDLVDYLESESIDSGNVLFAVWGMHAQPYFLRWGDFRVRQIVFDLFELASEEQRQEYLRSLFTTYQSLPESGDTLYLPLYSAHWTHINESILGFLDLAGAEVSLEKKFLERNGEPAILLYRVDGVPGLVGRLCRHIREADSSAGFQITRFGPPRAKPDRIEDLPMWFPGTNLSPTTRVTLDGVILRTVYGSDHITALVPYGRIREPGRYQLFLYDPERHWRTPAVELAVE